MIAAAVRQLCRPFRYLWVFKLTAYGKVLIVTLAVLLFYFNSAVGAHLLAALLALLALALLAGLIFKPRLHIAAAHPLRAVAYGSAELSFQLHNPSRRPAFDLAIHCGELPDSIEADPDAPCLAQLTTGKTEHLRQTLHCSQRGRFSLPQPQCVSSFPFGFFRTRLARADDAELVVYPRYGLVRNFRLGPAPPDCLKGRSAARAGQRSHEYLSSRPYRPGDDFRDIDARAWARLAQPAVKEFHDRRPHRLGLILGPAPQTDTLLDLGQQERFEAAVSLTASLAHTGLKQGHHIDLIADSRCFLLPPDRAAHADFDDILGILAALTPQPQPFSPAYAATLIEAADQLSAVCVIVFQLNDAVFDLTAALRHADCQPMLFHIAASETPTVGVETAGVSTVYHLSPAQASQAEVVLP